MPQSFSLDSPALSGPLSAALVETTDAADSIATTYTMTSSDTFSGTLGVVGDRDWVAITLTAGETYNISLGGSASGGGTLTDPYLRLYDAFGMEIAFNDDSGPGLDSLISFTATTTGTYYIAAGSYNDGLTGTYNISVSILPPPYEATLDELADYLTDGFWAYNGGAWRAFDTSASNQITVDITTLSAAGQQLARRAFEAWEMVADLEFVEVTSGAVMTFQDTQNGAYSSSGTIGNTITSSLVNISTTWLSTYGTTLDSYSFATYIHEIGHALGLGHQGPYNGSATYGVDNAFANDSWQYSIMSYFNQNENTFLTASYAAIMSAQMVDIIAIQNLYGAPGGSSQTDGDTIWGLNSNLGGYWGDFFDILTGGSPAGLHNGGASAFTVYDLSGIDLIDLSYSTANNRVDLIPGTFSDVEGLINNVAIARGTFIENVITGSGNDNVNGNYLINDIQTRGGNDYVSAQGGSDNVSTGTGDDTVLGGNGNDTIGGGAGSDLLSGNAGNDVISGSSGNDTLNGNNGADQLSGGGDNDVLSGGNGNDLLFGSSGNDQLFGGAHDDYLDGGTGRDQLVGEEGSDTLLGYTGLDTLSGGGGNDVLNGGNHSDVLDGNGGDDMLIGGWGRDTLNGGWGDDTINGGTGNDMQTGSLGADTFIFSLNCGTDVITDFVRADGDRLQLNDALWAASGVLNAWQVLSMFSSINGAGDVVLTFAGGENFTLDGVTSTAGLASTIDIF